MRILERVAAAAILAVAGAGCAGDGTDGAAGGGQLEVSGSVSARLEGWLSANWAPPDSVGLRIAHMDVRSNGFAVADDVGGFVVVGGLDLDVAQVVERSEHGQGGHLRPVASRVDGGRLLVMDQLMRSVWAYPMGSGEGGGFGGVGELVVDADLHPRTGGMRTGPRRFGMLTDFAVRADGSIVAPVHEGPTYLGVVWPPRDSVAAGPAWDTRADAGEFGQLFRYSNRVEGLEDGGLLIWDDYSAVVIEAAADGTESRWSLPEEYRRTGPPDMWPRYGSDVRVDLGSPTMSGWSAVDGSVCMVVRPVDVDQADQPDGDKADLLWLHLGGAGELPELRRINDVDARQPVSCGIVGDVLLVATMGDVLRYRLWDGTGGAGDAAGGELLGVSGSVSARLERRLSASGSLPDSVFGEIVHMDVRPDGFSVVDELGKFVATASLDLEVERVVGRQGEGPGELGLPVASRVHGGRVFVMDRAPRRIWAYPVGSGDGAGVGGERGELVVDLRTSPGSIAMSTDFAVRADGSIVAPVREGPTYLGTAWPPLDSVAAGPAWEEKAETGEFGWVYRFADRVAALEDGGLLVWDDYSAVVIVAAADGTESRWSLPEGYGRTGPPKVSRSRDGRGIETTLKRTMKGWAVVDGTVCMAVRPADADDAVDLLLLELDAAGEVPELRRIELDGSGPMDTADLVSCGIVGDALLVATEIEVLRYRLGAE